MRFEPMVHFFLEGVKMSEIWGEIWAVYSLTANLFQMTNITTAIHDVKYFMIVKFSYTGMSI